MTELEQNVEKVLSVAKQVQPQPKDIERILCAACKYLLDDKELITMGFRHNQPITVADKYFWTKYMLHEEAGPLYREFRRTEIQGFITTQNRFVDRKEAAKIAFSAGQIPDPKDELYSEDLY